ncbi:Imm8 family immunity protein [Testudinibacter sp. P80/BLE/0925]|uniref:Imm8 family immunity protein n=1 Tax=Testudinibacter sp. TW-1 TaxID=3417757 RepID=UPI003D361AA0
MYVFAELKRIDFNGYIHNKDEAQNALLDSSYFIPLCLSIGEKGKDGADFFDVDVFNTGWVKEKKMVFGGGSFIFDDFDDFDDIEKSIKNFIDSIYGESWSDVLIKLRKYFSWEYENYQCKD